jgi:sugar phosphate isomerase/epimerase
MSNHKIAVQLYAVRDACAEDLPGTLERIARMGYNGVEFAGYYGYTAQDLRKMLADNGLKVAGSHVAIEHLLEDEFEKTVEFHLALGNKYLIVPYLGNYVKGTRESWLDAAHLVDAISQRLTPHGLRTGYHNHGIEFELIDGETPWDTFFGNTRPEVVMQIDVGNSLQMGGVDAVPYLERYPNRAATVHFKDYKPGNPNVIIGEGDVRWSEVFRLCEQSSTEWYIVEQEAESIPSLDCADRSLKALRDMGW